MITGKQSEFIFSGEALRDAGISLAVEHAESKSPNWKQLTFDLFKEFLKGQEEPFRTEQFREWIALYKPDYDFPPSLRAFGGTILKAANDGLIRKIGHGTVSNAKAHKCFAALWLKI